MAFFDLFTQFASTSPADTFVQVVLGTSVSATLTIGPRADESQQQHYELDDKEAFAQLVQADVDAGTPILEAFVAHIPGYVVPTVTPPATTDATPTATDAPTDTTTPTSDTPAPVEATTTSTPAA